jgi:hypothetical protein
MDRQILADYNIWIIHAGQIDRVTPSAGANQYSRPNLTVAAFMNFGQKSIPPSDKVR